MIYMNEEKVEKESNRKIWKYLLEVRSKKGPYIYDVHTAGGWGSLEICHLFADSIVFKQ